MLDGLVLRRCRHVLAAFWGPCQAGGVHEALASVLALVIAAQLRMGSALPLILVFLDLVAAYDVANRDDMRAAASRAGVHGQLWLLIDDLLASDNSRINLAGACPSTFKLECGTAQGRRLSGHLFNGCMKVQHDI